MWVLGDSVRLTQVFSNLLHNAIKFSAADGIIEIGVRVTEDDKQVAVSVRDEGAGIAAELIESVFDLFTQEQRLLAKDSGGLGIGLSVVRRFTEMAAPYPCAATVSGKAASSSSGFQRRSRHDP